MKERSGWLSKILLPSSGNILSGAGFDKGYKNFSRSLHVIDDHSTSATVGWGGYQLGTPSVL